MIQECLLVLALLAAFSHALEVDTDPSPFVKELAAAVIPAFEKHALLLKGTPIDIDAGTIQDSKECIQDGSCETVIPTLFLSNACTFKAKSLVQPRDLNSILSQPNVDYKNGKVLEGNPDIPVLVDPQYPLIINNLERHWEPVTRFARHLEMEFQMGHVSCFLFVPPFQRHSSTTTSTTAASAAIDLGSPHWDWRDIIILQLQGQMKWSVWSETHVVSATKDIWHKSQSIHAAEPIHASSRYEDVLLAANDVLYIPRGTLHNATALFTKLQQEHDNETSTWSSNWFILFGLDPAQGDNDDDDVIMVADWISSCLEEDDAVRPWIPMATKVLPSLRRIIVFRDNARLSVRAMFQTALHDLRLWVAHACQADHTMEDDDDVSSTTGSRSSCQAATVPTVYWDDAMAKYEELAKHAAEQRMARWEREDARRIGLSCLNNVE